MNNENVVNYNPNNNIFDFSNTWEKDINFEDEDDIIINRPNNDNDINSTFPANENVYNFSNNVQNNYVNSSENEYDNQTMNTNEYNFTNQNQYDFSNSKQYDFSNSNQYNFSSPTENVNTETTYNFKTPAESTTSNVENQYNFANTADEEQDEIIINHPTTEQYDVKQNNMDLSKEMTELDSFFDSIYNGVEDANDLISQINLKKKTLSETEKEIQSLKEQIAREKEEFNRYMDSQRQSLELEKQQ